MIITGGVVVLLTLAAVYRKYNPPSTSNDMVPIAVETFQVNGGWGYRIIIDRHPYIYQDIIPGIPGNHPFHSKEDAQRVGNVVMQKLMQDKNPGMSPEELSRLGVI